MATVAVSEIQRDPLGYLRRVEQGETLQVERDERPVAEIKPVPAPRREPRPFGLARGEFVVPDGFDRPLAVDLSGPDERQ